MIKLKDLILETLEDWSSEYWIHYSNVDYIKVNKQPPRPYEVRGVYLFPLKFIKSPLSNCIRTDPYFVAKKYRITATINSDMKILDLGTLNQQTMVQIAHELGIKPKLIQSYLIKGMTLNHHWNFWNMLKSGLALDQFQKLGYDAIFDDVGAILDKRETQLVVFDDKNVNVVKVELNDLV